MIKKYELLETERHPSNSLLRRIKYLREMPRYCMVAGELGGWLESEQNLSHKGNCAVLEEGTVSGNARVQGDAIVRRRAQVFGNARISSSATVTGEAQVSGDAIVAGDAYVTATL